MHVADTESVSQRGSLERRCPKQISSLQILLTSSSKLGCRQNCSFCITHIQPVSPTLPTVASCLLCPLIVSSPHPQPQVLICSSWALGLPAAPSSSTPHLTIWWVYPVSPALHLYNRFHFILHSSILMITFSGC